MYVRIFFAVEALLYFFLGVLPALFVRPSTGWTALALACIWLNGALAFSLTKRSELANFLTIVARHYFLIAVPLKVIPVTLFPALTTGLLNVDLSIFPVYLDLAVYSFLLGSFGVYGALVLWSQLFPVKRHPSRKSASLRHSPYGKVGIRLGGPTDRALLLGSFALIALKLLLIEALDLSKPGVVPKSLGIPGLTGLLNTLAIHGLLWWTLLVAVKASERRRRIPYAFLLPLASNVFIDVVNGYKFSLISVAIVLMIVSSRGSAFGLINKLPIPKSLAFRIVVVLLGIVSYPIIDSYADLTAAGVNVDLLSVSLRELASLGTDVFFFPITEILRRANGIDAFIISHALLGGTEYSWTALWGTEVVQDLRVAVYGQRAADVVSALGSTIFNTTARLGNLMYVPIALGAIVSLFYVLVGPLLHGLRRDSGSYYLMRALMALEFVRIFFSAGDLYGNLKIILTYMLLAHLWLLASRIGWSRIKSHNIAVTGANLAPPTGTGATVSYG